MATLGPRLIGLGFAVPANVRTNDDPIFDYLKGHDKGNNKLFTGFCDRHVLVPGEDLMTIMVPAAQEAMADAGLFASDIDMLLGTGSISPWSTPNELARVHQILGLPDHCRVIPLNCEFSNFNAGVVFADSLIRSGRARNVLVVVGTNWTRHVSYETPQSISAGDGAGAAVIGLSSDESRWALADDHSITQTKFFGSMFMAGENVVPIPPQSGPLFSNPFFQITALGLSETYKIFGVKTAPEAVVQLLARNGLKGSDVTLTGHQSSSVLVDNWVKVIQPADLLTTIQNFANMTAASIPVNLAWAPANHPVTTDYLVCLALGDDAHADAMLLRRGPVE